MKLYILTAVLLLFMPFTAQAQPETTWTATITESHSACKNLGKDIIGVYDLKIQYGEGKTLTITVVKSNHVFNGIITEDSPRRILLKTSYLEDAGIVTEKIKITFEDEHKGLGIGNWYWSDGLMSCGGSYNFTVVTK
jgi:hypothetical protein